MTRLTMQVVERQARAMGAEIFEIGVRRPCAGMLLREWAPEALLAAIPWLQYENARGADVYIRPARNRGSALVLVDDLTAERVESLPGLGLAPCVVVETSSQNFQVWIRLTRDAQPPAVRTAVARYLAAILDGDMNSADYAHFGRLAGLTNRKASRAVNGLPPFVRLVAEGEEMVAQRGEFLVREALQSISRRRAPIESAATGQLPSPAARQAAREAVEYVPQDGLDEPGKQYTNMLHDLAKRYAKLDTSRADWMCALEMLRQGYDFGQIARAMLQHSPGLSARKADAADYLMRTVGKAEIWHELRRLGYTYGEVRHELLQLARIRAEQRRPDGAG